MCAVRVQDHGLVLPQEAREDQAVAGSIGKLLLIYGAFVASLVWIPNTASGRGCFAAIGGVMVIFGILLWRSNRTHRPPMLSGGAPNSDNHP